MVATLEQRPEVFAEELHDHVVILLGVRPVVHLGEPGKSLEVARVDLVLRVEHIVAVVYGLNLSERREENIRRHSFNKNPLWAWNEIHRIMQPPMRCMWLTHLA